MKNFLTAEWTDLVVATYEVDKTILEEFVPCKTELNDWNGKYLLSILGFMFCNPAIMGIKMPFFHCFPEINLRFYVKCKDKNQWRPGVVFIKEISPSILISRTAKLLYHENFISLPMQHTNHCTDKEKFTRYSWKSKYKWNYVDLVSDTKPININKNMIESFICNQFTAFTKLNDHKTLLFEVNHKPWKIYPSIHFRMDIDAQIFPVKGLSEILSQKPIVSFLMDGSFTEISKPCLL